MSKIHSGNVQLILNFKTGDVTAQWNVVFDNWVSTVTTNVEDMSDYHADKWSKMFGTSTCNGELDNEIEESLQQPVQPIACEIKDDSIDEEEAL